MAVVGTQEEISSRGLAAFGAELCRLRVARGLSLRKLSAALRERYGVRIGWMTLARIEAGRVNPKLLYVVVLCRFFRVSAGRMMDQWKIEAKGERDER